MTAGSFPVHIVPVDNQIVEHDAPGPEKRVGGPLDVRVGDSLGLAVAMVSEQLCPVGERMHQEIADEPVPEHLVKVIDLAVGVRLPAVVLVLDSLCATSFMNHQKMRHGDIHSLFK